MDNIFNKNLRELILHLMGFFKPSLEEINKTPKIIRYMLQVENGCKAIMEIFDGMLLKLSNMIKENIVLEEEENYKELIQKILKSNDKLAIFSLLSIYSKTDCSSKNGNLNQYYCEGLLYIIESEPDRTINNSAIYRHRLNIVGYILNEINNPLVSECLEKNFNSYYLMKKIVAKYIGALKNKKMTFEECEMDMKKLGLESLYTTLVEITKDKQ